MKISIILLAGITTQDHYDLTSRTLESLSSSKGFNDCEFIIVDNGSVIGGDVLAPVPDIYIRNKVNQGFTVGMNQGIKVASGDILVLANNDIRLSPNWIEVTQQVFEALEDTGSLHFKMIPYDEPFNLSNKVWNTGKERWCHGSFYVIRKQVFDDLGLYDEGYGLGGYDDWDLQYRIRKDGRWRLAYTNGAAFQHQDSSTYNTHDPESRRLKDENNLKYFQKKYNTTKTPEQLLQEDFPDQFSRSWKPFP